VRFGLIYPRSLRGRNIPLPLRREEVSDEQTTEKQEPHDVKPQYVQRKFSRPVRALPAGGKMCVLVMAPPVATFTVVAADRS